MYPYNICLHLYEKFNKMDILNTLTVLPLPFQKCNIERERLVKTCVPKHGDITKQTQSHDNHSKELT